MTYYQQLFYEIKHTRDYKTVGEDIQYKIIVDDEKREVILQFEESTSKTDWLHNVLFLPFPLRLDNKIVWTTWGYALAYRSTQNQPINEFVQACEQHVNYAWKMRGWSFGSAMTKIAVRHFYIREKLSLDEELTYGDVKVWLNPFLKWMSRKWVDERHEFTYINDFVTWCVPFYFRTNKCKVGGKFNLKSLLFDSEYNHTNYDRYDYSKY